MKKTLNNLRVGDFVGYYGVKRARIVEVKKDGTFVIRYWEMNHWTGKKEKVERNASKEDLKV